MLAALEKDLSKACSIVESKTGLPIDLNPLKGASWSPSEERVREMRDEISNDVMTSNFPDEVKDRYADTKYDQRKPYNQSVHGILTN